MNNYGLSIIPTFKQHYIRLILYIVYPQCAHTVTYLYHKVYNKHCDIMKSTIEIPKDEKHRIVIPKGLWKALKLEYGDFIEIDITKAVK